MSHLLALLLIVILHAVACEEDRKPSMFKVGEDWLALPEVFSNLDFAADSTPATEEDIEGQLKLRSTRFWGRIYIDGWPQTIQYFRAHFGIEPPLGRKQFVFPEPRDACEEIKNADKLTSDHVLLVHRGRCTFGTKAKNAEKTNATAIIIINNEPGIDHLPGPDAHDIQFSISSITQQEGQLLEAVYDEGPSDDGNFGRLLEGYLVPINCEFSGARCVPASYEERRYVSTLAEGGYIRIDGAGSGSGNKHSLKESDQPIEYLLAHYGTKMLHQNVSLSPILAKPVDACSAIQNDVKGKVVLVRRGGCPFVKKAEEVQAAGGRVVVVGNQQPYIVRMGVEPRWKGLNTAIPVVMASKRAYSILVAESFTGGKISFVEDASIGSAIWEPLEKLFNGEGWPRSEAYMVKKYEQLLEENAAWPDRLTTVTEAYAKKSNSTTVAKEAGGSVKSEL